MINLKMVMFILMNKRNEFSMNILIFKWQIY